MNASDGSFEYEVTGLAPGTSTSLFARVRELNQDGFYQYSASSSITVDYQPTAFVTGLGLVTDDGTAGDGATSDGSIQGTVSTAQPLSGYSIEISFDDGATIAATETLAGDGSFTHAPSDLSAGYQTMQVRATDGTTPGPWQRISFVYDSDPQGELATNLVAALAAVDPNWQSTEHSVLASANSSGSAGSDADYEADVSAIEQTRHAAQVAADNQYAQQRRNAEKQFQDDLQTLHGTSPVAKANDDLGWGAAPDANAFVRPADDPTPGDSNGYSGPSFNEELSTEYQNAKQTANRDYRKAVIAANEAYASEVETAVDNYQTQKAASHVVKAGAKAAAYLTYLLDTRGTTEDIDPQVSELLSEIYAARDAYGVIRFELITAYLVAEGNGTTQGTVDVQRQIEIAELLDRKWEEETIAQSEIKDGWYAIGDPHAGYHDVYRYGNNTVNGETTQGDNVRILHGGVLPSWSQKQYDVDLQFSEEAKEIYYKYAKMLPEKQKEMKVGIAEALKEYEKVLFDNLLAIEKLKLDKQLQAKEGHSAAFKDYQSTLASLDKAHAERVADAARTLQQSLGTSLHTYQTTLAIKAKTRDFTIADARYNAASTWASSLAGRWSAYQEDLAKNLQTYQHKVAELNEARLTSLAGTNQAFINNVAQEDYQRTTEFAKEAETFTNAALQADHKFKVGSAKGIQKRDTELVQAWKTRLAGYSEAKYNYDVNMADAEYTKAYETAKLEVDENMSFTKVTTHYDTFRTLGSAAKPQVSAYFAIHRDIVHINASGTSNSILDQDQQTLRDGYDTRAAEITRTYRKSKAAAKHQYNVDRIDAHQTYRDESNEAFHSALVGVSSGEEAEGFYIVEYRHSKELADAYKAFDIAVTQVDGDYLVNVAKQLSTFQRDTTMAEADFLVNEGGTNGVIPAYLAKLSADDIDKNDHETAVASDYVTEVTQWAANNAYRALWEGLQITLAQHESTATSAVNSASSTAVSATETALSAWATSVRNAQLAATDTLYGSDGEDGLYVDQVEQIVQKRNGLAAKALLSIHVIEVAGNLADYKTAVANHYKNYHQGLAETDAERDRTVSLAAKTQADSEADAHYDYEKPIDSITLAERDQRIQDAADVHDVDVANARAERPPIIAQKRKELIENLGSARTEHTRVASQENTSFVTKAYEHMVELTELATQLEYDFVEAAAGAAKTNQVDLATAAKQLNDSLAATGKTLAESSSNAIRDFISNVGDAYTDYEYDLRVEHRDSVAADAGARATDAQNDPTFAKRKDAELADYQLGVAELEVDSADAVRTEAARAQSQLNQLGAANTTAVLAAQVSFVASLQSTNVAQVTETAEAERVSRVQAAAAAKDLAEKLAKAAKWYGTTLARLHGAANVKLAEEVETRDNALAAAGYQRVVDLTPHYKQKVLGEITEAQYQTEVANADTVRDNARNAAIATFEEATGIVKTEAVEKTGEAKVDLVDDVSKAAVAHTGSPEYGMDQLCATGWLGHQFDGNGNQ